MRACAGTSTYPGPPMRACAGTSPYPGFSAAPRIPETMATRAEMRKVRLFQDLDDSELDELLPSWTEVEQPRGTRLMIHGSPGFGFMVILEGQAEVSTPDGATHKLGPGDFFGEMELLDHRGRSATVESKTPMRLLALVEKDFKPMLLRHPQVAYRLLQTLSRRIRDAEAR